jgi:hypothetical protein
MDYYLGSGQVPYSSGKAIVVSMGMSNGDMTYFLKADACLPQLSAYQREGGGGVPSGVHHYIPFCSGDEIEQYAPQGAVFERYSKLMNAGGCQFIRDFARTELVHGLLHRVLHHPLSLFSFVEKASS